MPNLNTSDRNQAKKIIESHLKAPDLESGDDAVERITKEIQTKFKKNIQELWEETEKLKKLKKRIEKKVGYPFEFDGSSGEIELGYQYRKKIKRDTLKEQSIKSAESRSLIRKTLAKLQTIKTREELERLFKSIKVL